MVDLDSIFLEIKKVLEKNSENLLETEKYIGSQAKSQKPAYHLYGTEEVSLFGKKPQNTYFAGVIKQKNYVSFYFSPVYSHPDDFKPKISSDLNRFLKGKSCFNLTKTTPELIAEIDNLLDLGIKKYKEIKWI